MVYTRSHLNAARTLVSMNSDASTSSSSRRQDAKFWSIWNAWYDAFLCEVQDEGTKYPKQLQRFEATRRCADFCRKQQRCDTKTLISWLNRSGIGKQYITERSV